MRARRMPEGLGSLVQAVLAAGLLIAAGEVPAAAPRAPDPQPPAANEAFPFADPEAMFDLLFGETTEEEKRQLAAIRVSPREERETGTAALASYLAHLDRRGIRVMRRGRDVEYLTQLVECVRRQMPDPKPRARIKVCLARSPACEARCFPGGTIVFFEGLLEEAESEAALVGIVGHELAHLHRGHLLGRIRRIKLAQQTLSGEMQASSPQAFFASGAAMVRLWTRPFEPELEREADRDGATWAYRAGYDPREMAALFRRLAEERPGLQVLLPAFLRSHPMPADRHGAVMDLYEELQRTEPKEDLYVGKENLHRRVTRARRRFRE